MAMRAVSPTLIGRDAELGELARALATASTGETVVVLAGGEAGVGKSRLLAHAADRARQAGVQVALGRCVDLDGVGLPLAPLRQIVEELVASVGADVVEAALGPALPSLGALVGNVGGSPPPPALLAVDQLCVLVVGAVRRLARSGAVLLGFEDLHWADPSSRAVFSALARLGRLGPVLLIGTFRSDELGRRHPLVPDLAEIERAPWARRIELRSSTPARRGFPTSSKNSSLRIERDHQKFRPASATRSMVGPGVCPSRRWSCSTPWPSQGGRRPQCWAT
jgi:hypothetical protein